MTQQLANLHLFSKNNEYASFNRDTFSLMSLNKTTYQVINLLQKGKSIEELSSSFNISTNEIKELIKQLSPKTNFQIAERNNKEKNIITRITLHVSNDCNLRCKYCYASGGSYKGQRKLMGLETAKQFVDFCINTFRRVENIVFFGGEPFLNPQVIEFICKQFTQLYEEGTINYCPNFGAITNGTLISEKSMVLIKKYFSFLTVSIDGPQAINDINRIDRFGKGSYNHIKQFIIKAKKMPNLWLRYEATFTKQHQEMGYTHQSLKDYFKKEFDLEGDVINETCLEKKEMYTNSVYKIKEDENTYDSTFWSILISIVQKQTKSMCPLYRGMLAISVDGELFPCHMNTGEKECSLGNINGSNIYNDKLTFITKQPGLNKSFKANQICNKCWAKNICGGCSRLWFYDEEKHVYEKYPKPKLCKANNRYLEEILFQIINLRKDTKRWEEFTKELK